MHQTIGRAAFLTIMLTCVNTLSARASQFIGTLNGPDFLVTLDSSTALGARIGPLGIPFDDAMTALEWDSARQTLYGATSAQVPNFYSVDVSTGLATRIGAEGAPGFLATGMAYDPQSDRLYASGGDRFVQQSLYVMDRSTGQGTLLGGVDSLTGSLQGLAFDSGTNTLYALEEIGQFGARIVSIDPLGLSAAAVTTDIDPSQNGWNGLVFDPGSGMLFASSNVFLYEIDPVSGSSTQVGRILTPEGHTVGALTVPEPSALAAVVIGLSLLFVFGRFPGRSASR